MTPDRETRFFAKTRFLNASERLLKSMRNIRLTLAYDGTNYVGWQVQPNGPSIQAAVEQAIFQLTGETVRLIAAGRTDAGVHALGQVANFTTGTAIPCAKLQTGLQNFLADDVVIRDVSEVDADFHATYSAQWKRYRYVIFNNRESDPFIQKYAWQYAAALDAAAMHDAAQVLLGTHDFRCFESHFPNKATSVRTVIESKVERCDGWPLWSRGDSPVTAHGEFIRLDIAADGFLYNMVRAIVGTLLKVGRHQWTAADVRRIIDAGDRSQAGETAPARGLYLVHVEY